MYQEQSMKPTVIFSHIIASLFLASLFVAFGGQAVVRAQNTTSEQTACFAQGGSGPGTCSDGKDNDGDCRADWAGVTIEGETLPPDPACVTKQSSEYADDVLSSIIPCTDKCDLGSVFELLNNLIGFLIKVVMFPIAILMFMYAGYKYITAQGNPAKKANVKKMAGHLIGGLVLILCAWVIVKTVLILVGYEDNLFFFE